MRLPYRPRHLSSEEARLWSEIAKLVTPLKARAAIAASLKSKPSSHPSKPVRSETAPTKSVPVRTTSQKLGDLSRAGPVIAHVPPPSPVRHRPGFPGLERKEKRALQRGTASIEARIDLHGLYQAEAHDVLVGFITKARTAGYTRILVVTGKGRDDDPFSERGVLRRSVPHWLRGPALRASVLGFEEAGRQHGGAGALYVRLKRR